MARFLHAWDTVFHRTAIAGSEDWMIVGITLIVGLAAMGWVIGRSR